MHGAARHGAARTFTTFVPRDANKHFSMHANYFELFGLQARFSLDQPQLTKVYHSIQNQLHPDRYVTASSRERRLAEQKSALVNEAYRVLSDECSRADYLLILRGQTAEPQSRTKVDDDFLLEQMELRQELEACATNAEYAALGAKVAAQSRQLGKDFDRLYEQGDYARARIVQTKMQFFSRFQRQAPNLRALNDGEQP